MDMLAVFRALRGKGTGKHRTKSKKSKKRKQEEVEYFHTYCGVQKPAFGNHYHWSFVIWHGSYEQFEVVRTSEDGPWEPNMSMEVPKTSGCFALTSLADLPTYLLEDLYSIIQAVEVKQTATWNSQDYVKAIWDGMYSYGMIGQDLYEEGRTSMMFYHGEVNPEVVAAAEAAGRVDEE
ncbi:hypothetical protein EDB81DRAFT_875225 [Dactylonectria macrodidyma]|uniref:Uncharacterized protein n=1 Tax=Dactylonectria macrodidyma TaxID=307937 RepID=A0A9P9FUD3_9HYPO|nr:hypothetical protein EDB81DRAFT_875225 [Dactylonectria macrodidyma]